MLFLSAKSSSTLLYFPRSDSFQVFNNTSSHFFPYEHTFSEMHVVFLLLSKLEQRSLFQLNKLCICMYVCMYEEDGGTERTGHNGEERLNGVVKVGGGVEWIAYGRTQRPNVLTLALVGHNRLVIVGHRG